MLLLNASAFYQATALLERVNGIVGRRGSDQSIDDRNREKIARLIEDLIGELNTLEARTTSMAAKRLRRKLDSEDYTFGKYRRDVEDIFGRLRDELTAKKIFVIDDRSSSYWNLGEFAFGQEVVRKYPTALFEIDEATKCFALGRPTACVFHLMRTLEIGIASIARCLGIPDPVKPAERNWSVILRKIRQEGIDAKWPSASDRISGDGAFFDSLYASLDAVRNPWRNATMHVETKYTEDEAEHIFLAVGHFMKKTASRLDENGEPHA